MIARVAGQLVTRDIDRVEVMTASGIAYEIVIPLSVFESLPRVGENVSLHTHLVVKDDGWQLFGFSTAVEREVFRRVLGAKGVGPSLAIGLLSALSASRLVRAIRNRDVAALQSAPRVGRKKAEQLILDLADKLDDLDLPGGGGFSGPSGAGKPAAAGIDDAIRALMSLGYSSGDAERAVRKAIDGGDPEAPVADLIRRALASMAE